MYGRFAGHEFLDVDGYSHGHEPVGAVHEFFYEFVGHDDVGGVCSAHHSDVCARLHHLPALRSVHGIERAPVERQQTVAVAESRIVHLRREVKPLCHGLDKALRGRPNEMRCLRIL